MNDKPDLWFAVGVRWYAHPRFADIQRPAAYGLFWAMSAWAREQLTDGFVPNSVVSAVLAGAVKADPVKDRAELVRVGLLKEGAGGVTIHRFLGWNDSAEKAQRRREAAREAALARWGSHADGSANGMRGASEPQSGRHTKEKKETERKAKHDDEGSTSVPSVERARRAS